MSKERIELSLDPETIKLLRTVAIKKYGNLRSVSRLIEDLAMSMCPECGDIHIQERPNTDIEAIKAKREEYCQKFIEEQDRPICWPCGHPWETLFACKKCDCEFKAAIPDAIHCPTCGSTDIKEWDIENLGKSVDDRIEKLELEKFNIHTSSRHKRGNDIPHMNIKELQAFKATIEDEISKRKAKRRDKEMDST